MPGPIKLACLSCRASRTRCDGLQPCVSCSNRGRDCVYQPSRRGGARVRKKNRAWEQAVADKETTKHVPQHVTDVCDLAEDADVIFDALFSQSILGGGEIVFESPPGLPPQLVPSVRTYPDDGSILDAYYIFIHPYFPILPPPKTIPRDQPIPRYQNNMDGSGGESEPSTSISLAISAMLALIPGIEDPHPSSKESVLFRRDYAQYLAQCALECIEIESEIPESSVDPAKALLQTPSCDSREPFHPEIPLELESIIALDILSAYEYAQRGNLKKMESRAGQALMAAMSLSLHLRDDDGEPNEAKRRVWWMTYICVSQAAIVGNIEPSILAVFIPTFATEYPALKSDAEAFSFLIQAQQAMLATTQFSTELSKAVKFNGDMDRIHERMRELDSHLESLIKVANSWVLQPTMTATVDSTEGVVSRSLRCMTRIKLNSARIKLHRYSAFESKLVGEAEDALSASESSSATAADSPSPGDTSSLTSLTSLTKVSSCSSENGPSGSDCFSSHQSAKICLRAALNMAQAFDDLPYPNPPGQQTSSTAWPRMMPSLACCALQCAFVLTTIGSLTRSRYSGDAQTAAIAGRLLGRLQVSLLSISTALENYATAFEAIGGTSDQVRQVLRSTGDV
ncbi:Zn(2)-C6 fungal-type domain-containing protein [Fusarium sp. Ph1]|nr:Zn(2)-C6 fungal-type domain-containing protein [Fusarium sp. Ph1]